MAKATYSDEMRAAVMAALLAGQSVTQVVTVHASKSCGSQSGR